MGEEAKGDSAERMIVEVKCPRCSNVVVTQALSAGDIRCNVCHKLLLKIKKEKCALDKVV